MEWESFEVKAKEALLVWKYAMHMLSPPGPLASIPTTLPEVQRQPMRRHSGLDFPFDIRRDQLSKGDDAIAAGGVRRLRELEDLTPRQRLKLSRQVCQSSRVGRSSDPVVCAEWDKLRKETPRRPEDSTKGNVPDAVAAKDRKKRRAQRPPVASTSTTKVVKIARTSLQSNKRDRDQAATEEGSREGAEETAMESEEEDAGEDEEEADELENLEQILQDQDAEILEDRNEGEEVQEKGSDPTLPTYRMLEGKGKYWVDFRKRFD